MTKHQETICIVIPYFGRWPFWISCFLESCRINAEIQWLIYTDCGMPEVCPANVKIVEITYKAYCENVSISLGIQFSPENRYKLCDIKPALGYIHAKEIEHFDFWAFGDIDLIYGNLRNYFTTERLARKDVFSTHARRISGHFCLIRNTAELRSAFMRVKNWRRCFETPEHLAFDESAFTKVFLRHKNSPNWVRRLAEMTDPWLRRAEFVEAYTTPNGHIPWVDGSRHYPTYWYWQNGYLTNDLDGVGRLIPYFHFMVWKKQWEHWLPDHLAQLNNLTSSDRLEFSYSGLQVSHLNQD